MRTLGKSALGLFLALGYVSSVLGQSGVQWHPSLEGAKGLAAQSGQLVMVYFWAPWCPMCLSNERDVLGQPNVAASIRAAFVAVKVNHDEVPELVRHCGVRSLPAIVVLTPEGVPLDRVEGRLGPQELASRLSLVAANARKPDHPPQPVQPQPPLQRHYTPVTQGVQQAAPTQSNSPAGPDNPPLGLDGYCAVSLNDDLLAARSRWVLGQKAHGVIHRGRTYLFADAERAARFFQDPDRYAPILSGQDVVLAVDEGRQVEGRREHGAFFGHRVYLFASEETLQRFENHPNRYADAAVRLTFRPMPLR